VREIRGIRDIQALFPRNTHMKMAENQPSYPLWTTTTGNS